ncbi:hypothetical protein ISN45_Aa08g015030 [Arabidopsis thaliana x Arabidopsis arenosa]|uniref:Uncharacterized protein n=1 Tax=Arabidopsis thaliana x Arabidopsis arenosa TaxID=1240361 RepID=A0A8T1XI04_9BRAS|nr:hypothetical protein ISN45_Aa08g015030 [Arabidopsis thaliana x Arabidopsis arenosa]
MRRMCVMYLLRLWRVITVVMQRRRWERDGCCRWEVYMKEPCLCCLRWLFTSWVTFWESLLSRGWHDSRRYRARLSRRISKEKHGYGWEEGHCNFGSHDLMREVCLQKAEQESFVQVIYSRDQDEAEAFLSLSTNTSRRISVQLHGGTEEHQIKRLSQVNYINPRSRSLVYIIKNQGNSWELLGKVSFKDETSSSSRSRGREVARRCRRSHPFEKLLHEIDKREGTYIIYWKLKVDDYSRLVCEGATIYSKRAMEAAPAGTFVYAF